MTKIPLWFKGSGKVGFIVKLKSSFQHSTFQPNEELSNLRRNELCWLELMNLKVLWFERFLRKNSAFAHVGLSDPMYISWKTTLHYSSSKIINLEKCVRATALFTFTLTDSISEQSSPIRLTHGPCRVET